MTYREKKAIARGTLLDAWDMFAENADKNGTTCGDLADFQEYLLRVGRRYSLIKELRENGLI